MILTRVYPNGERVVFDSESANFKAHYGDVEHWHWYNQTFRFGCALYDDGVCVWTGNSTVLKLGDKLDS